MTDETTARDRATELIHETLEWERERRAPAEEHADVVVDALLAHPEVLRALAGVPTADVARKPLGPELTVIGDYLCATTNDCTCGAPMHGPYGHEQHCGYEPIADMGEVRKALAAAPEGVDAATPSKLREMAQVIDDAIEHHRKYRELDAEWLGETARQLRILAAAAEGVDAADERDAARAVVKAARDYQYGVESGFDEAELAAPRERLFDAVQRAVDDGMDLEAQGEMADQLAAAQAAIQVAQKVLYALQPGAMVDARSRMDAWRALRDALRALDGDTTEEA